MTYSPGSPGYQPAQPGGSNAGATPSFAKDEADESKLPRILNIAVLALGLLVYILNFFPTFVVSAELGPGGGRAGDAGTAVIVALLAALLAGLALLPKAKSYAGIIAVIAVLGALLAVTELVNTPAGFSVGVAMYILVACSILQAFAAAYALLLDVGVATAPKPRPKLDPYAQQYGQYGQYGQQYGQYGQYGQQPYYGQPTQQHPGQQAHNPQQPAPGYVSQYGGYPQQSNAPTQAAIPTTQTGGFGAPSAPQSGPQPAAHQQGTSTPPTGFPSFSPPAAAAGGAESQGGSGPVEYSGQSTGEQPQAQEQQSSSPSGPAAPA